MTTVHHHSSPTIVKPTLVRRRSPGPPLQTQEVSPPSSDSALTPALKHARRNPLDEELTPPEEPAQKPRKTSVTFDLPGDDDCSSSESEPEYHDRSPTVSRNDSTLSQISELEPPSLDISGQRVPSEILVALLDRPSEMRELAQRNHEFFSVLRAFIRDADGRWEKFVKLVFVERAVVGDLAWIEGIRGFLGSFPAYFEKFKEIVGFDEGFYDENADCGRRDYDYGYEDDDEDGYHADDTSDDDDDDDRYPDSVDFVMIRRLPARLANFERSYPQFFVNARQSLCAARGPHGISSSSRHAEAALTAAPETEPHSVIPTGRVEQTCCTEEENARPFAEFVRTLFAPRRAIPDDLWDSALRDFLTPWPNLLAQFKEIVAYEIEDGWGEEEDECEEEVI